MASDEEGWTPVAELVMSSLWLRRFRFGPFEWLWRSITYGSVQPLWKGVPAIR